LPGGGSRSGPVRKGGSLSHGIRRAKGESRGFQGERQPAVELIVVSGVVQQMPDTDRFKEQMRASLLKEAGNWSVLRINKHDNAYSIGGDAETIYFIESGQVKLVVVSPEGRECMIAIHAEGDIFGELCLSGHVGRMETATAMEDTVLNKIPAARFLNRLAKDGLLEGFVRYLAVRVADQQIVIANLVTVDSEQRLGRTLLQLAEKLGRTDPQNVTIELRISHEELAAMVGTTRPRISVFMQRFRNLGLTDISAEHYIMIKKKKLMAYLRSIA
jgi:CRP/FNR family cyclic AMP-dependent transcriptional regulator